MGLTPRKEKFMFKKPLFVLAVMTPYLLFALRRPWLRLLEASTENLEILGHQLLVAVGVGFFLLPLGHQRA